MCKTCQRLGWLCPSVLAFSLNHSWALVANVGPALFHHNHLLEELETSMKDNLDTV